jgi:hypothetical protein
MQGIEPCYRHENAINGQHAVDWQRALQIAVDCPRCEIVEG